METATDISNLQPGAVIMVSIDALKKAFLEWSGADGNMSSKTGAKDEVISAKAVTEMLNVDRSTLWRWEKEGLLTPMRVGRKVYYEKKEIEQLTNGYLVR